MTIYDKWKMLRACCGIRGGRWDISVPWRDGPFVYASDAKRAVRFLAPRRFRSESRLRKLPPIAAMFDLSSKAMRIGDFDGAALQVPWKPEREDDDRPPLVCVGLRYFSAPLLWPLANAGPLTLYLDRRPQGHAMLADLHAAKGSFLAMALVGVGDPPGAVAITL